MNKTIKKIGVLLFFIILLPAVLLTGYQIYSLNEDEKLIEEIYSNQLDAILFSVNQYSEDIVSQWANQIDNIIKDNIIRDNNSAIQGIEDELNEFLKINAYVNLIFLSDSANNENLVVPSPNIKFNKERDDKLINNIVESSKSKLSRLYTYIEANYRKIEPIESQLTNNDVILIFLLNIPLDEKKVCGIIINPVLFTTQVLSPKIQSIAQNEFVISIFNKSTNTIFYQSEKAASDIIQQSKPLWLIPGGEIGIALKGTSIETLVEKKFSTFIIVIGILTVVLIIGVWIVFSNIRKEIKLAQIKSDFVSNVSHELRTPLALISMFAETLEMGRIKSEEKKSEYYKIISQETNRLGRIVNTILNFSKTESGKRKFNFIETDINSIVDKIFSTYQFHLENKGFKFTIQKSEKINPIKADEEALSEAIINLVDNAVKYSQEDKEIKIRTGMNGDYSFVEIEDTGIGISDEDQKKIFDKFYRVSTGLVHNVKGTGLGLTLVKHIIETHKGEIEIKSKLGKGSNFRLKIPVYNKE